MWNPETDTVTADTKLFVKWIKKADTVTPPNNEGNTAKVDTPSSTDNKTNSSKKAVATGCTLKHVYSLFGF